VQGSSTPRINIFLIMNIFYNFFIAETKIKLYNYSKQELIMELFYKLLIIVCTCIQKFRTL
jgi:hypothetical protein